jgi:hypothetical protein
MKSIEAVEIIDNDNAWDTGELGRDESAVKAVHLTPEQLLAIDDAANMQMISIRLPKELIEQFKFLGDYHGIRYQTLMRQILARFAESELKNMAKKAASAQRKATRHDADIDNEPENSKSKKVA